MSPTDTATLSLRVVANLFVNGKADEADLRAACERHGVAGNVDSYIATLIAKAARKAEIQARADDPTTCIACDGHGRIAAYSHIQDGLCFTCGGSGKVDP